MESKCKMVNVSSYGSNNYETVILENSSINDIKEKYLNMAGRHLLPIFERELSNIGCNRFFTLPYSYDTIIIYLN